MKKRSLQWVVPLFLALGASSSGALAADDNTAAPADSTVSSATAPVALQIYSNTNFALSGSASTIRAPWQQRLTLGAGDVLNFALFLNDTATEPRENVVIGPDGRVSYLQAVDIMAAGLTIDELRARMDVELGKYYRLPRTIVTPVAINSKRYFVLGSVVRRGVYPIDRPLTIIEAIGRAGGLETGVFEHTAVEMTDLSRSFLVRQGQKVPVDFEKLFQQGDLSQNIALEPDDYLFFASSSANEVYVLGAVAMPGVIPRSGTSGVVSAISSRGGFAPKAFQSRVLVIRGSLNHPETFIVNTKDILAGKTPDFRLQSRDIVYVSRRPWARAEEILEAGTQSFIEALIVTYTGNKLGPFITPFIH